MKGEDDTGNNNSRDLRLGNSGNIVSTNLREITMAIGQGGLFESGGHNLLVYHDLPSFREIYSSYAKTYLARNEIILLATQYEDIESVKRNLEENGIDVRRHTTDGTLFVVDAQKGYFDGRDVKGTFKLALTLVSRVKKEKRRGFTWIGDAGSFFAFHAIQELMDYELSLPQVYEDAMKTVCSYHEKDFENLSLQQRRDLLNHHYKSILVE